MSLVLCKGFSILDDGSGFFPHNMVVLLNWNIFPVYYKCEKTLNSGLFYFIFDGLC